MSDDDLLLSVRNLSSQRLVAAAILAHIEQPAKTAQVREKALKIGYRAISKWNLSDVLSKASTSGWVAQLPTGWKILPPGLNSLREAGVQLDAPIISETRHALRRHIATFANGDRQHFLEEAIGCFEAGYHRGAIVLSWVGAASIIQEHVVAAHLPRFNQAGLARFPTFFRPIRAVKDFGLLKEADILQLCQDASILDKAEKAELQARLDLRNRCGHPNSVRIAEHTVAHHLEILILNVYARY